MQQYLTSNNLESFVLFAIAICWAIKQVVDAWLAIKRVREEQSGPVEKIRSDVNQLKARVVNLEDRYAVVERITGEHEDEMRLLLRSQIAMLSHQINGNSTDKLRQSLDEINDYLTNR